MGSGLNNRSSEPATISAATTTRKIALAKAPSTSTFQVPKAKRSSAAQRRAAA